MIFLVNSLLLFLSVPLLDSTAILITNHDHSSLPILNVIQISGIVTDIEKRCEIYRNRIKTYEDALKKAADAKKKNENRAETHATEKAKVKKLTSEMVVRQCW